MTLVATDATRPRAVAARRARQPALRALQRFFRTPKGLLLLVLALLAALAAPREGLALVAPGVLGAMGIAALLDAPLLRLTRGEWQAPTGALLSGLIVALVLAPRAPWYVPLCTAVLAVNSKYLFRTRWANVFNPAAIALVAAYALFGGGQSWWGALPDLPLPFIAVLLAAGLFVVARVNKLPMVLAFAGGYFALFTLAAFAGDPARVAEVFRVPTLNAALFFAFFMLSDPPTSPTGYRDQVVYGALVAGASAAIYLTLGGVYFLPAGLLVGNAWESWRRVAAGRRRERARRGRPPAIADEPGL
jgi:Na+-translocating ferredoxin:NAD+ oxidoreductase RnfD subunit